MLLANTANKLFFRSTDPEVRAYVEELWPQNPSDPSAVAVRPLSTLRAGECYAVTADGRFEMCQLDPWPVLAARPSEADRERLQESGRQPASPSYSTARMPIRRPISLGRANPHLTVE